MFSEANISNEKRAQAETSVARVQFPAALESVDSDAIIKQHNGYVKDNIPSAGNATRALLVLEPTYKHLILVNNPTQIF